MHGACGQGYLSIVAFLIQHGADVNSKDVRYCIQKVQCGIICKYLTFDVHADNCSLLLSHPVLYSYAMVCMCDRMAGAC